MTTGGNPPLPSSASARTVQDYIDETPVWADATEVSFSPITNMQWLIWGLATAGKFFEGAVVFTTGVALPLMGQEFGLGATEKGVVASASLFGILIGATAFGDLADRYGRKQMFITEMVLFAIFVTLLTFSQSYLVVVVALLGVGIALGCDYPTAHLIISESMPSRIRGRMVLSAFGFQAVGGLVGTGIGLLILFENPDIGAWRWMYASTLILAIPVIIGRFFVVQSPPWLVCCGRIAEAEVETKRLLQREPRYPKEVVLHRPRGDVDGQEKQEEKARWSALFRREHRSRTILASVPWFLQDLSTYGIGIFTPTILATVIGARIDHPRNTAELIQSEIFATKGAALIDVLLIVGIVFAVVLADRVGRMRLQILGFIGCALGLLIAALSLSMGGTLSMVLLFAGFMLFSFMTNIGPNAMTYLIAGEVFPISIRGVGAGFAASFAKIGAVLTAFLFPVLLKDIGTFTLLMILVGTSLLGALVTWRYAFETKGVNLEKIDPAAG
jgi:MFS transporter, putative metabolite transport protein